MAPDSLIKHPLQNRWALWFFKNDRNKEWTANLKLITAFDTVEDFWALYNHVQKASKLPSGCDYSLFKDKCHLNKQPLTRVPRLTPGAI
uniref:Eukaryotic translation initiation factor 4E n=1 Tax=Magallana gigas TaxID=29159 RepID=K1PFV4_MAGGI